MDALRIATNFYTFRMGVKPESMAITVMEPADGRIVMQTTTCNAEGEEITYEIEFRPTTNGITMKQVISDCDLSDFIQDVKHLSDLKRAIFSGWRAIAWYGAFMVLKTLRRVGLWLYSPKWSGDILAE